MVDRISVGITGQNGFIGNHLFNYLNRQSDIELKSFTKEYFNDAAALRWFVASCDVIVHLAAISRHPDGQFMYDANMQLTRQLIAALEAEHATPKILFASTTHENRDTLYHASKRDGLRLLEEWAARNGGSTVCLLMPNAFGPFSRPDYNSMVATFCHKVTHGETPEIMVDAPVKLIHINELCREIYGVITGKTPGNVYSPPHSAEKKVSEILTLLEHFRELYLKQGIIPEFHDAFEQNLFNSFHCYIDHRIFFPLSLEKFGNDDTSSGENSGGKVSFLNVAPGETISHDYHTQKITRLTVIKGRGKIQIRRVGVEENLEFKLSGKLPSCVDIPVCHTYSITNIGQDELCLLCWRT